MTDLNLGSLISKFVNYQAVNSQRQSAAKTSAQASSFTQSAALTSQTANTASVATQMGTMASVDQSAYVKEMMNLPKNLNEFIYMLQKNITLAQLNQNFLNQSAMQRNSLSQTQAQILAQLQGLSLTEAQNMLLTGNKAVLNQLQNSIKNLAISSNGLINLSQIASIIQANGKDAMTKLITAMANSAKLGITDLSQMKDTAKLINASVAAASQNDSAQTMKMLLLLYLPWLPLQEGLGFDLDIEAGAKDDGSDSILVITITTLNFGNVTATLILESSNSVHVNIECVKNCLIKNKNIIEQSKLNKEERQKNIQGVYILKNKEKLINKKLLLIDDIFTTGSTVNECCKILKQANPRKIDIFTIAKD